MMLHCGKSERTGKQLDKELFSETRYDLLFKYDLNHFHREPVMPIFHNLSRISL